MLCSPYSNFAMLPNVNYLWDALPSGKYLIPPCEPPGVCSQSFRSAIAASTPVPPSGTPSPLSRNSNCPAPSGWCHSASDSSGHTATTSDSRTLDCSLQKLNRMSKSVRQIDHYFILPCKNRTLDSFRKRSTMNLCLSTSNVTKTFFATFRYLKLGIEWNRLASSCFNSFCSKSMCFNRGVHFRAFGDIH